MNGKRAWVRVELADNRLVVTGNVTNAEVIALLECGKQQTIANMARPPEKVADPDVGANVPGTRSEAASALSIARTVA